MAISRSKAFELIISIVIVLNCITLALQTNKGSQLSKLLDTLEVTFFVIYVFEMICKIIAHSFILRKGAYLRDPWNFIDFAIILASIASFTSEDSKPKGGAINFSSLRVLRILKPLKTIKSIKKLRTVITALLESMPYLADIFIIILFTFAVFAIIGLQVFSGSLQYQCVNLRTGKPQNKIFENNVCGGSVVCPRGFDCVKSGYNPQSGIYNFDDFFSSYFMIFIIMTLEGWSLINSLLIATTNPASVVFCITIIIIESFFLINLALAIITAKFCEANSKDTHETVRNRCSRILR